MIRSTLIAIVLSMSLLVGCSYIQRHEQVPGEPTIFLDIDKDFRYVNEGWPMGLSVGQTPAGGLDSMPYETLLNEPEYLPGKVQYGYIELGNSSDRIISFALHEAPDGVFTMFVDLNNNEDLSDDGLVLHNQGTGRFASEFSLDVDILLASGDTISRPYNLWLWVNEKGGKLYPRFYTQCHYEGDITIGGRQFKAVAYEMFNHDALYNDSGLWIDLDVNGKLDEKSEHFPTGSSLMVDGIEYTILGISKEVDPPEKTVPMPRRFASSSEGVKPAPRSGKVADIDSHLPLSMNSNPDAIAVVIGNSRYKKTKDVKYALNDARTVRDYLVKVLGYKEGNIFHLDNASKADFELFFGNEKSHKGKLFNAMRAGRSDVFVFYSGHGAPGLKDRRGYFIPIEADPQYLELSGYPLDLFYANMAKLPARSITVVLDACFSGTTVFDNISPMLLQVDKPVITMKNAVVISSSTDSQVSSWYNEKGYGMFTYFFLKSIHNKNADLNGDNELTLDEIYRYIADESYGVPYYARRIHGVEQNPTIEGQYKGKVLVRYR